MHLKAGLEVHALTGYTTIYKELTYDFFNAHVALQIITVSEAIKETSDQDSAKTPLILH